jgi:hypothetical protein
MDSLLDFIVPAFSASLPFAFLMLFMGGFNAEAETHSANLPDATVEIVEAEIEIIDITTFATVEIVDAEIEIIDATSFLR